MQLVDLGEVDADGVARLLDEAIGRTAIEHRSGEEAVANTAFTLLNDRDSQLDISAFGPDRIHIRFDGTEWIEPKLFGFLSGPFQYEAELPSRAAVLEVIAIVGKSSDADVKAHLEHKWGKASVWKKLRR